MNQLGDLGKVASKSKAEQSTMDKFFKKVDKKENVLRVLMI